MLGCVTASCLRKCRVWLPIIHQIRRLPPTVSSVRQLQQAQLQQAVGTGGVDSIGRDEFRRMRRHSAAAERRRIQCEVANEVRTGMCGWQRHPPPRTLMWMPSTTEHFVVKQSMRRQESPDSPHQWCSTR